MNPDDIKHLRAADPFLKHEALDRCSLLASMADGYLLNHEYVQARPDLLALATEAVDKLAAAYQAIGASDSPRRSEMTDYTNLIEQLLTKSENSPWDSLMDDAAIAIQSQGKRVAELEAARIAYASEFALDENGDPDVGSIHANIRKLKSRIAELESRLEFNHEAPGIDGIYCRDETIRLQEARIAGLESGLVAISDSNTIDDLSQYVDQLEAQLSAIRAILPDDLYSHSKDWSSGDLAYRIEWLKIGYESEKSLAGELLSQLDALAKQEPVAYINNDRSKFFIPSMEGKEVQHSPYLAHWMVSWDRLYTNPIPTDPGKVTVTTDDHGRCVAVTRTDDEHRILSVIWEAGEMEMPVNTRLVEALKALDTVIGCFNAASCEGLSEALAETPDARLKDLIERRLMHALYAAQGVSTASEAQKAEPAHDLLSVSHRLALELECLLLDTKDMAAVSRWWDSANEALDAWRSVRDSIAAAAEAQQAGPNTGHADMVNRAFQDGINSGYAQAMMDEMARHRQSEPVRLTDERIFDICKSMLVEGCHGDYLENDGFELAKEIEAETLRANGFKVDNQ